MEGGREEGRVGGRGTAAIGHERWRKEREEGGRLGEGRRGTAAIGHRYAFVVRVTI